jgi:hypothetical protein
VSWRDALRRLNTPPRKERSFGDLALGHEVTGLLGVQAGQATDGASDGAQARTTTKHRAGPQQPKRKGSRVSVNAHPAAFGTGSRRWELAWSG